MKNIIILGVVAVAVAGAAIYALLFHQPVQVPEVTEKQVEEIEAISETVQEESFKGAGPLGSLLSYGKNLECAVTYIPNEFEQTVTGTYFVSGVSVRGDFIINSPELGGQVVSSIIMNDDTFYSWSTINGISYGMKSDISTMNNTGGSEELKQPVPQDAKVEYACDTWNPVDGSVFVPPSTVRFQEYGALLETGMEYSTIYNEE